MPKIAEPEKETVLPAEKDAGKGKKDEKNKKEKAPKEKKQNLLSKTIESLLASSRSNTEASTEKKRFPLLAISATVAATAMSMVIVASFMQISQIQADMKNMQAQIRELNATERELSMELEGRYSSKIESIASDMGLSGKYHPTYYLDGTGEENTAPETSEEEDESKKKSENSLLNAISHSFKKFLEFLE